MRSATARPTRPRRSAPAPGRRPRRRCPGAGRPGRPAAPRPGRGRRVAAGSRPSGSAPGGDAARAARGRAPRRTSGSPRSPSPPRRAPRPARRSAGGPGVGLDHAGPAAAAPGVRLGSQGGKGLLGLVLARGRRPPCAAGAVARRRCRRAWSASRAAAAGRRGTSPPARRRRRRATSARSPSSSVGQESTRRAHPAPGRSRRCVLEVLHRAAAQVVLLVHHRYPVGAPAGELAERLEDVVGAVAAGAQAEVDDGRRVVAAPRPPAAAPRARPRCVPGR